MARHARDGARSRGAPAHRCVTRLVRPAPRARRPAGGGGGRACPGQAPGAERAFLHDRAGAGGGRVAARRRGGDARGRGADARDGGGRVDPVPLLGSGRSRARPRRGRPPRPRPRGARRHAGAHRRVLPGRARRLPARAAVRPARLARAPRRRVGTRRCRPARHVGDRGRVAALRPETGLGAPPPAALGRARARHRSHPRRRWPRSPRRTPTGSSSRPSSTTPCPR